MPGIVRVRLPGCTAARPDRLCLERTQPDPSRTDRFRPAVRPEGPSEMNAASRPRPVAVVAPARRPDDQQRLSDLIGVIYDAAIDPSLWECAIERAAYFVGGNGAALINKDVGARSAVSHHQLRIPDASGRPVRTDLSRRGAALSRRHRAADCDHRPASLLENSARPNCIVNGRSPRAWSTSSARFSTGRRSASAIFGVFRHERNGLVDERARRQMRLIAPHIRRAVLISRMFEFKAGEVATFIDALDGLSDGNVSRRRGRAPHSCQCRRQRHPRRRRYPEFRRRAAGGLRCTGPADAYGMSLRPRARATQPLGIKGIAVSLTSSGRRALRRPCPTVDVRRAPPRRHKSARRPPPCSSARPPWSPLRPL